MKLQPFRRFPVGLSIVLVFFAGAVVAPAQTHVYDFERFLTDNTNRGDPLNWCSPRPFRGHRFKWTNGHEYMMIHGGVDVVLYDLTPPIASPLDSAGFNLGWACGNSPEPSTPANGAPERVLSAVDLLSDFSICDGCRWGVVTAGNGNAYVFDLGTGTVPSFQGRYLFENPSGTARMGATFKIGSQQYVQGYGADASCGVGISAIPGVYQISADQFGKPVLSNATCYQQSQFNPAFSYQKGDLLFWVESGNLDVHVSKLTGALPPPEIASFPAKTLGPAPGPSPVSVDMRNYPSGDGYMLVIDKDAAVPATLYRVHDNGGTPEFTAELLFTAHNWLGGAVNFPYLFLAGQSLVQGGNGTDAPHELYSCEDTGTVITCSEVDHDYWNDPTADYNSPANPDAFFTNKSPAFSYDGQYMFFGRYIFMPLFKFTGPAEPTPKVSNSPLNPFPGDTVTVKNDSLNWDQAALWVDTTPDGTGTPIVGDPSSFSSTMTQLLWPSSDALDCTLSYWEHVDIRPIPNSGVSQAHQQISFNCSPTATVSVTPQTALVGSTVTVTASAEGHPGSDTGDPYQWTIIRPDQTQIPGTGSSVQVNIDQSGQWSFQVKVQYRHTTGAGVYSYTSAPLLKSYASVAPAVSVTPATPSLDDDVILGADGSLVGDTVQAQYTYYLDDSTIAGCAGTVTGGPGGAVTIPDCNVGKLAEGQHTAKLQLTAGQDDLTSDPLSFNVVDTSAAFTATPANPQIGQDVTVVVTSGTVQWWDMDGKNCAGDGPTINCLTFCNLWTNFKWAYDSSGQKTIELHTTEGGLATQTIDVQATGSCPVTCTYTVTPSSLSVSAAGGGQTVSVSAGATCQWSARSNVSWITAVNPSSGPGNAFVTFTVAANSGGARSGTLTIAGKTVTVNQSASGGGGDDFTISDTTPAIGQTVTFTTSASPMSWDMGEPNCAGESQIIPCSFNPALCQQVTWSYPTQGARTIKLTTASGTTVKSLTVQSTGVCPGTNCDYALSPTSASAPADGITASFSVVTDAGCPWTATSSASWLRITAGGSGAGSGSVTYTVDPNTDPGARTGTIDVKGETFTITQAGAVAKNAVIPAVAHTVGQGGTDWRTDMWIHNPNTNALIVSVRFFPDNTDNTDVPDGPPIQNPWWLAPNGTVYLPNILQSVDPEGDLKGALGISVDSGELTMPLVISSRTFNTRPTGGTYGQFVPVVDGSPQPTSKIILTGLRHDADYRTNIGLVNGADRLIGGVTIHVLGPDGTEVGSYGLGLFPFGMTQVDGLLDKLDPPPGPMDNFSVVVDFDDGQGGTMSQPVTAYASVIDNRTGDAIFIPGQTVGGGAGASFVVRRLTPASVRRAAALDFTISNSSPQIGETVMFTVTGGDFKQISSWDFDGVACDGSGPTMTCDPFFGCGLNGVVTWTYGAAGAKTVTAHFVGGGSISHSLTVQDAGTCPGGGCTYSVAPTTVTVAAGGETKSVTVTADSGCSWSASVTSGGSWLHIDSGSSGSGNGATAFTADANGAEQARTGKLSVAGKTVTVQQGFVPPQLPGNGDLLIPAGAHTVGEFGTAWQTDLWIFNPGPSSVTAAVRFYQSNRDNSGVDAADPLLEQALAPNATLFVPNIVAQVDPDADLSGALRVGTGGGEALVVSSRTYNTEDAGGTFGQFVPANSGSDLAVHQLLLTGLRHDAEFRTNIGLASSSANAIGGIVVRVLDDHGTEMGTYELGLFPFGMTQIDSVLEKISPPLASLQTFSVVIDFRDGQGNPAATDQPVTAYASVIDNQTGDATFIPAIREQ